MQRTRNFNVDSLWETTLVSLVGNGRNGVAPRRFAPANAAAVDGIMFKQCRNRKHLSHKLRADRLASSIDRLDCCRLNDGNNLIECKNPKQFRRRARSVDKLEPLSLPGFHVVIEFVALLRWLVVINDGRMTIMTGWLPAGRTLHDSNGCSPRTAKCGIK